MAPSLKHKFTTGKSDGTDVSLLRPSNWNDEHDLTLAADNLLGRATAGTGAVEEIPCTAAGRTVLAAADIAAICAALSVKQAQTGDVQLTLQTSAPTGWLMFDDGTIGNAASGATRANADTQALFTLLWGAIADVYSPIFSSTGATTTRGATGSAANAWTAGCRISLPKTLGRALAVAGGGSGLTGRPLGGTDGSEVVGLTSVNLPDHTHSGTTSSMNRNATHHHTQTQATTFNNVQSGGSFSNAWLGGTTNVNTGDTNTDHEHTFLTDTGNVGNTAHPNMQPTVFLNAMVKL